MNPSEMKKIQEVCDGFADIATEWLLKTHDEHGLTTCLFSSLSVATGLIAKSLVLVDQPERDDLLLKTIASIAEKVAALDSLVAFVKNSKKIQAMGSACSPTKH